MLYKHDSFQQHPVANPPEADGGIVAPGDRREPGVSGLPPKRKSAFGGWRKARFSTMHWMAFSVALKFRNSEESHERMAKRSVVYGRPVFREFRVLAVRDIRGGRSSFPPSAEGGFRLGWGLFTPDSLRSSGATIPPSAGGGFAAGGLGNTPRYFDLDGFTYRACQCAFRPVLNRRHPSFPRRGISKNTQKRDRLTGQP